MKSKKSKGKAGKSKSKGYAPSKFDFSKCPSPPTVAPQTAAGFYNKTILEHFSNPHNYGKMDNPDGIGRAGNPICGDVLELSIKVKNNRITDIRFQTLGCAAAIATSSMITDLAKGKILDEAFKITNADVAGSLGGLPPIKMHCSNLAAEALQNAIKNYRSKHKA